MKRTAVILAGGFSKRFGRDKGLVEMAGKPLIRHVTDRIIKLFNEIIVVVSNEIQKEKLISTIQPRVKIIIDKYNVRSPIVGTISGFEISSSKYSFLFGCDTPFISINVISFLLQRCKNKDALIPRWPNRYTEPLHAVYNTKSALKSAEIAYKRKQLDMNSMIDNMKNVQYISTLILKQLDPRLITFFNVNTIQDLEKAEYLLKMFSFSEGRARTRL